MLILTLLNIVAALSGKSLCPKVSWLQKDSALDSDLLLHLKFIQRKKTTPKKECSNLVNTLGVNQLNLG